MENSAAKKYIQIEKHTSLKYIPIIGLEVHIQLKTKSKMFCGCGANWFGRKPNTLTCPVCLGLPGALPVPNRKAVEWTIMLGLALNCKIDRESKFDRKNYFYPDLPKGYQISQYDKPIAVDGYLKLKTQKAKVKTTTQNLKLGNVIKSIEQFSNKKIKIRRVHLEEDTAKLLHVKQLENPNSLPRRQAGKIQIPKQSTGSKGYTLIDFNRSGMPLVEIVTEPDIRSSEEAVEFLKKLRQIVRYIGISDADMEKGSLRIEPNISVMCNVESAMGKAIHPSPITNYQLPPYKVEVKNINSFRFARRAIDYEIERQGKLVKQGKIPKQETRGWDEKKQKTVSQRAKEEAHDYRYFPEPDIPPLAFNNAYIHRLKADLPELSDAKADRFVQEYGISKYYAKIITKEKWLADYFEAAAKSNKTHAKAIANWIVNKKVDSKKVSAAELAKLIVRETQREEIPQPELRKIINKVLEEKKGAVEDYKKGKKAALGFLVGKVMSETRGKANAVETKKLLLKQL
jgi:aspartyl-tRNA(Asn)/glutamyl-tRNA(Gln) amidotransferase subunit B